jgi:dihydroxy-acid dehydratase
MTTQLNKYSSRITAPKSQGASQAMLYATGLSDEDLQKAQVGISSVWFEGNSCNMHLLQLAEKVKEGVTAAGLVGMRFNTIGVSDGISMGTDGMSFSLQSRDLIADSIETVMSGQWYDANISLPGCDKNMPGCLIAMGRLNRPSLMVYGGTIRAGHSEGQKLDVISAFQSYGEFLAGKIDEKRRREIIRHACPGAGACGGMYTANTMASAIEVLGMSLPYSSSTPAEDPQKLEECFQAGAAIRKLLELDLKPRDIMTRPAFENAIVLMTTMGGSTNAVLHLIAMARAVGVDLTIDDFQAVSNRVPLLADFKPSGLYVLEDLHRIGGIPAVVRPLSNPLKASGHIQILKGNLAPEGAVAKITGKEGLQFSGPAKVYDSEEDMLHALERKEIGKGDIVVIRYEGPKGGPGMPEMLTPTSAVMGAGLGKDVALITDGRFSGGSHGFIVGHITPEAQEGGPIALIRTGDRITIDAEKNLLNVDLSNDELAARRKAWKMPPYKSDRGTLAKYIRLVKSASLGCVTDE